LYVWGKRSSVVFPLPDLFLNEQYCIECLDYEKEIK
jgi:hypothetical protein